MRSREEISEFLKQNRNKDISMTQRAKEFAEFAHAGQRDKAGQPYIQHPIRVGDLAAKLYSDDNLTAAAYMHDVVEDGNFTVSDLSMFFPRVVWAVVELLTRKKSEDRDVYIDAISKNLLATKVKMADLTDNMDLSRLPYITDKDYDRQGRYIDEYRKLAAALDNMSKTLAPEEQESDYYEYLYM